MIIHRPENRLAPSPSKTSRLADVLLREMDAKFLGGEGWGEGARSGVDFPLTLALSPRIRGEVIQIGESKARILGERELNFSRRIQPCS